MNKAHSLHHFADTSEDFLDQVMEQLEWNKPEDRLKPLFSYDQMKDFASLFALIHVEKYHEQMKLAIYAEDYRKKSVLEIKK